MFRYSGNLYLFRPRSHIPKANCIQIESLSFADLIALEVLGLVANTTSIALGSAFFEAVPSYRAHLFPCTLFNHLFFSLTTFANPPFSLAPIQRTTSQQRDTKYIYIFLGPKVQFGYNVDQTSSALYLKCFKVLSLSFTQKIL